ncbi:MAG: hypothetical protein ACK5KR_01175 [Breznakia sp.]
MKAKKNESSSPRWVPAILIILVTILIGSLPVIVEADEEETIDTTTIDAMFATHKIQVSNASLQEKMENIKLQGIAIKEQREKDAAERARLEAERLAELARIEEARYTTYGVCAIGSSYKKNYMDYRVLSPYSVQGRILNAQTSVQSNGLLVTSDGFIATALGSSFGSLGNKFRITTATGQVFKIIKVDEKADYHTTNGCQDSSGSMIEFIVDTRLISPYARTWGSFHVLSRFSGNVVNVESYN